MPDYAVIKDALSAGVDILGAQLIYSTKLVIRWQLMKQEKTAAGEL
ncbi:hypothetical protein CCP3SC15_1040001 [Gammaproteobacteria bacterium]